MHYRVGGRTRTVDFDLPVVDLTGHESHVSAHPSGAPARVRVHSDVERVVGYGHVGGRFQRVPSPFQVYTPAHRNKQESRRVVKGGCETGAGLRPNHGNGYLPDGHTAGEFWISFNSLYVGWAIVAGDVSTGTLSGIFLPRTSALLPVVTQYRSDGQFSPWTSDVRNNSRFPITNYRLPVHETCPTRDNVTKMSRNNTIRTISYAPASDSISRVS